MIQTDWKLKIGIRDASKSPVAKNRRVNKDFILGGSAFVNLLFCFTISGSIFVIRVNPKYLAKK